MAQLFHNFNVLFVDDDPIVRSLARNYLKDRVNVFVVDKPSVAFRVLDNEKIDLAIIDFILPEMDGLHMLQKIKKKYDNIEVIMISITSDIDTVIGALRMGAADYCKKPFDAAALWLSIERTKKFSQLQASYKKEVKKNEILKEEFHKAIDLEIIGVSDQIKHVKEQIKMVASTPDTSVLLIGESGTGKELVARGIHMMSRRNDEFFGAVNMSAVPESLFESEFFGHKKGSFTGAIADKAGWFETSNKGSLFLDEIGDMPLVLQVKLLRVLEDRNFIKLGTQHVQNFDIRIISATNKSIEELSSGKLFRLDLFHRIGTFIITIPPLRERKKDISILTKYFMQKIANRMGKNISSINENVFKLLVSYNFPGNIRELRNMVERAVIMCAEKELRAEHFFIPGFNENYVSVDYLNKIGDNTSDSVFDLKEVERKTIIKALERVDFNKAEAARLLNIEWNALYRRMQKYDITFPS